jgi:hypothetical protein
MDAVEEYHRRMKIGQAMFYRDRETTHAFHQQ